MKSIKTLALVTGLLAISGVSQAQFSSTWTAVSDYDFRGVTQSGKDPALQASADYAFSNGLSIGAWASNIDFGNDEDIEARSVPELRRQDQRHVLDGRLAARMYMYPSGDAQDDYPEIYVGFNAGSFSFKQWYSWDSGALGIDALYSEANYTASVTDSFSLAFHAGYAYGDYWDDIEQFDYAVQANYVAGKFTIFGKFTGTEGDAEVTDDVFNNEARFLVGVMTTFPWGD